MKMRILIGFIIAIVFIAPLTTLAFNPFPQPSNTIKENTLPNGPNSILSFIDKITDWIFTILLVLAVIFILLAAYHYLSGKEESVQKAHRMLMFTIVAVAVALLSFGFVTAVQTLVAR